MTIVTGLRSPGVFPSNQEQNTGQTGGADAPSNDGAPTETNSASGGAAESSSNVAPSQSTDLNVARVPASAGADSESIVVARGQSDGARGAQDAATVEEQRARDLAVASVKRMQMDRLAENLAQMSDPEPRTAFSILSPAEAAETLRVNQKV